MMRTAILMKTQRRALQRRCCGNFPSFQGLIVFLLMEMTQMTLPGMQMGETLMEWFVIRLIAPNGRRLMVCIRISAKKQEILGLE